MKSYQRDEQGNTLAMRILILRNEYRREAGDTFGFCPECGQERPFIELDEHFLKCHETALKRDRGEFYASSGENNK